MHQEEKVSLTISIPKSYRDKLRTMAAQQNLHDPDQLTSASTIARIIVCGHIDKLNPNNIDIEAADRVEKPSKATEQAAEKGSKKNDRKRNDKCRTTAN